MKIVNGIYLPDRDEHFSEQIRNSSLYNGKGTYQYPKIVAALEHCRTRNTAIDVGANVGLWTRILANNFTMVFAIEPITENVSCLLANTEDCNNVEVIQMAISPSVGLLALKLVEGVATAYVSATEDCDIEVPCQPLDDLDLQNVSFIKVDAEGYEHQIIQSAEKTIREWHPTIVVEQKKKRLIQQGNDKHQPTVRLLESWGAREVWAKAGDHCLVFDNG